MQVTVFSCGPAANESEVLAVDHLKRQLQNAPGDDNWILLANLAFSVTHQLQSDEIDIVAIGPPGVRVIEVKHWSQGWADAKPDIVEAEANKATNKARKIGTTLRRIAPDLPHVHAAFFLTQPASKVKRLAGKPVRGVTFHTLNQWKDALGFDGPRVLSGSKVSSLGQALEPKIPVAVDGSLRRLAGYVNLELQSPREQKMHRVYKGSHPARRDRVVLHLYDLSASDDANAETKARREAETLQRLQLYSWAPRILDSWQNAPGYAGEMCFFTIVDPAAPSVEDRAADESWTPSSRLLFARDAVRALAQFHGAAGPEEPLVHRNLTPRTILVRYDNSPIFTGFDRTRIPSDVSVASSNSPTTSYPEALAPEIQLSGLAAADRRSDIYSLCACLSRLFEPASDGMCAGAVDILATGMAHAIAERASLSELDRSLSELLGDSVEPPPPPPARFWTEDQIVRFHGRNYRIVTRLGSGGIGTAFKVVEVDRVLLRQEAATTDSHIRFINLNKRSVVGGITADRGGVDTSFLQQLLDHLYGGARASEIWAPCHVCSAQDRCTVFSAARVFGPDGLKSPVRQEVRERARRRLFQAIQAVHLRGETHITVRELRAALVYILFGVHFCDDYHSGGEDPLPYWDRAFAAEAPARQGEVLRELTQLDPALDSHPQIDRYLLSHPVGDSRHTAPHYEDLTLESARRRAFFEWTEQDLTQVASDTEALDLARGRHLKLFRELPLAHDPYVLADITQRLCAGISRLEDLPPLAFERPGVVPLRTTQRTPTETAFWVEKPLESFYTAADVPSESGGVERLHRQAFLVYCYRDGHEEKLRLGAELFHLLLELGDGFQLGDVSTDDTFAHLSIFVQRLIREDERELFAWNPMRDDLVYRVAAALKQQQDDRPIHTIEILATGSSAGHP